MSLHRRFLWILVACPSPLKNRDFILQRSWLDTGIEQLILNHSVYHKDYPPRKHFVRATSYLTGKSLGANWHSARVYVYIYITLFHYQKRSYVKGYIVRPSRNGDGSELGYVSHTDPHGKLPVWLVNKVTQIFAPKVRHFTKKYQRGIVLRAIFFHENFIL